MTGRRGLQADDNRLLSVVAVCAALATFHGGQHAAAQGGANYGTNLLYPIMGDGLAVLAFRKSRDLDGWRRVVAWAVVIASAGASGTAQAYALAADKHGGAAVLAAGVGAFPAVTVLLATIVGSLRDRSARATSSTSSGGSTGTGTGTGNESTSPGASTGSGTGSAPDLPGSGSGSGATSVPGSDAGTGRTVPVPAVVRAAYDRDPTLSGAALARLCDPPVSGRQGQNYRRQLEAERRAGIRAVPSGAAADG